ncbi:hypothetical protein HK096_005492, partial [Nowakowskiella sp. JEL0078]
MKLKTHKSSGTSSKRLYEKDLSPIELSLKKSLKISPATVRTMVAIGITSLDDLKGVPSIKWATKFSEFIGLKYVNNYRTVFRRLRWMAEAEEDLRFDPFFSNCKAWSLSAMKERGVDIDT